MVKQPGVGTLILITGCPRSGTKYIACLLEELGLDVRHEAMGRDGISSWCLAVPAAAVPWGPASAGRSFDIVLHQVRNPIDVIPSMSTLAEDSWRFAYDHTSARPDDPPLLRCARFWLDWNLHAEKISQWRYRIEELPDLFDSFCQRVGAPIDRAALRRVPPNVNTRAFAGVARLCKAACAKLNVEPPVFLRSHFADRAIYQRFCTFSWETLRSQDQATCDRVIALAERYGYSQEQLGLVPRSFKRTAVSA